MNVPAPSVEKPKTVAAAAIRLISAGSRIAGLMEGHKATDNISADVAGRWQAALEAWAAACETFSSVLDSQPAAD